MNGSIVLEDGTCPEKGVLGKKLDTHVNVKHSDSDGPERNRRHILQEHQLLLLLLLRSLLRVWVGAAIQFSSLPHCSPLDNILRTCPKSKL